MRMRAPVGGLAIVVALIAAVAVAQSQGGRGASSPDVPRTPDGRPDLSGTYDAATLTPLERPERFGNRLVLSEQEARAVAEEERTRNETRNQPSDPNREAPPVGGDGSSGAAGNVGGYNTFWIDRGAGAFQINGQWRTSIIVDPENGRRPPLTPAAQAAAKQRGGAGFNRENTGTAWWVIENGPDAPGPYDDPELRPLAERCLLGFGSAAGPPMLPVLYNNMKKIVQTKDNVMIQVEMVHEARIVRMNAQHDPPEIRKWLGDSIGWWEADTLVVDTTNFRDTPALGGASRNLHVVERFTRLDKDTLLYRFTVEDPTVWTRPWTGEYTWRASDELVHEYACHEANYALGNIMRGARLLEAEALGKAR